MNRLRIVRSRSFWLWPEKRPRFWSRRSLWIWAWPWLVAHTAVPAAMAMAMAQNDPTEATEIRKEPVQRMISVLTEAILERHHVTRQWEPGKPPSDQSAQPTGRTAIAVLALLESGMPVQTPQIAAAIEWLSQTPADGTYAIAARLMVWTRLNERFLPAAKRATRRLLERFSIEGGGWDYGPIARPRFVDQSLTQFATQAIADASTRGIDVPDRLVEIIRRRFLARQRPDGGWGYRDLDDPARGSMTAAGLATLAICQRLHAGSSSEQAQTNEAIGASIDWLDRHFDPESNPGCNRWHLYWIHSLERAARATGIRRFGSRDWFSECATSIYRRLFVDDAITGLRIRGQPRIERLAFGLFVLQRGLDPIAFTCFDSTGETPTEDLLGEAVAVLSDTLERPVSWTRVSLDDPFEAWHRAPVLVVRGGSRSAWIEDPDSMACQRIFRHASEGGLIIAIPASGRSSDRRLFQDRLQAVFEARTAGLVMEPIAREDAARRIAGRWRIRTDQLRSPIRRWLVFPHSAMIPGTPGHRATAATAAMLAGLCLDACHGRIPSRLASAASALDDHTPTMVIRRLRHPGNWNPEPGMLHKWSALTKGRGHTAGPESAVTKVAWLTGVNATDVDHIELDQVALELNAEVLIIEAMTPEFTQGFLKKAAASDWRLTLPPKGCPAGVAGIQINANLVGLLIDAAPARVLFRGPLPGGYELDDLASINDAIRNIYAQITMTLP